MKRKTVHAQERDKKRKKRQASLYNEKIPAPPSKYALRHGRANDVPEGAKSEATTV